MSFLRFTGYSVKMWGVFPQGHRKCQSAVLYPPLTYLVRGRTQPLTFNDDIQDHLKA